jgi:hypothetical protein
VAAALGKIFMPRCTERAHQLRIAVRGDRLGRHAPHHDSTGASCVISIIIIMRALVSHTWW